MIKGFRFIICLFTCVFASVLTTEAEPTHTLSRIERLSSEILIPYLNADTCVTISYKGYPVVIERKDEEISHIGIAIFSDSLKSNTYGQIYKFIEQYLLELLTYKTKGEQAQRMFDDGVIIMGDLKHIPLLSSHEWMSLSEIYEQSRGYKIEWSDSKSTFSISFPPRYELISGLNKMELENQFASRARAHKITKELSSCLGGDPIRISEDLFVVRNGFYILEQMECSKYLTWNKSVQRSLTVADYISTANQLDTLFCQIDTIKNLLKNSLSKKNKRRKGAKINNVGDDGADSLAVTDTICLRDTLNRIYTKDSLPSFDYLDSLTLICDVSHPIESLRNLLSTSSIQNDYTITIKVNKYGFKQEVFSLPLSQLIDFCLQEGCTPYIGIEKVENETITAVLIMVQPNYGYNHIFKIEFNSETLKDKTGIIHGVVNVYTPTHNISNLYGEDNNTI